MGALTARLPGPVKRLEASHSYGLVFILIVITFSFTAASPDERWSRLVSVTLQGTTLIVALWTSEAHRHVLRLATAAVVVAIAVSTASVIEGSSVSRGIVGFIIGLLSVLAPLTIARGMIRVGEVRAQTIYGALSIYLLVGIFFAFVFNGVGLIDPKPFFAQGGAANAGADGTMPDYLYFSFTTLTTTGYGDLTPAGQLGRTLANIEQLFGQAYLVTIVAFAVSRLPSRRRATGDRQRPAA